MIEYIKGEVSKEEQAAFEKRLAEDKEFKAAFEEEKALWEMLGSVETPTVDPKVKTNFLKSLDIYKEAASSQTSIWLKLKVLWNFQPQLKLSYGLILLCVGLGVGLFFSKNHKAEVASLNTEVSDMKQDMVLSLIENPSATERLRAVSLTSEIKSLDDKVIDALFTTLNYDSNENVRLMTLEALTELADNPRVREGLVKSIVKQTSPLLQTAMADVMLRLQEKSAVKPLQKVLKQDNLNSTVKDKVEETIQKILI